MNTTKIDVLFGALLASMQDGQTGTGKTSEDSLNDYIKMWAEDDRPDLVTYLLEKKELIITAAKGLDEIAAVFINKIK
jgi:hypothetical protein